ncbi:MAG: hypothetical protein E7647_05320 [Ruminococcaceae bacterium]|nr:hypothetical protein [Oscillospiraceae bacterium]
MFNGLKTAYCFSFFCRCLALDQDLLAIIAGVKAGKDEDFEKLKLRYKPLCADMANSFVRSGAGSSVDLLEEAERALLKAALSFDTSKEGITFGLYAKICVRNALISVRRANTAQKNRKERAKKESESSRRLSVISSAELDPEEMLKMLEDSLSDYEARVLREFFSGRSAEETAAVLGTDKKSVYNAVFRIRAKAKKLGD